MKQNTYQGTWNQQDWYQVTLNGKPFDPTPSLKLCNHSPDGFAWGYMGSGPAQLSLAILLEEFGEPVAINYYQDFKREVIGILPHQGTFNLTSQQARNWFDSQPIKEGVEFTL